MVKTGLEVFAAGSLWLFQKDGVVVYSDDQPQLSPGLLDARVSARSLQKDIRPFPAANGADLLSLVLLGPKGLRSWTRGAEVIEDDRPFLEYRAARQIGGGDKFLPILASIQPHLDDLSTYARDASEREQLAVIDRVRRAVIDLQLLPPGEFERRIATLERAGTGAAALTPWRAHYANEAMGFANFLAPTDKAAAREVLKRAQSYLESAPKK
jgi:hypothetical protein